jgi:transcriptional regulator NrdR family protein
MVDVNICECGSRNIKVVDSRQHDVTIWRTRLCSDCNRRFYTVEVERSAYFRARDIGNAFDHLAKLVEEIKQEVDE